MAGSPILPTALSRGARIKSMWPAVTSAWAPETARRPKPRDRSIGVDLGQAGFHQRAILSKRGTTSATVPTATRSTKR